MNEQLEIHILRSSLWITALILYVNPCKALMVSEEWKPIKVWRWDSNHSCCVVAASLSTHPKLLWPKGNSPKNRTWLSFLRPSLPKITLHCLVSQWYHNSQENVCCLEIITMYFNAIVLVMFYYFLFSVWDLERDSNTTHDVDEKEKPLFNGPSRSALVRSNNSPQFQTIWSPMGNVNETIMQWFTNLIVPYFFCNRKKTSI